MQIRGREILARALIWTMLMRAAETTLNSATSAQSALCTMTLIIISSTLYDPLTEWFIWNVRKTNLFCIHHNRYFKPRPPQARENLQNVFVFMFRGAFTPAAGKTSIYLTYRSNNSRLCFHWWRPALYIEAILENLTSLLCR